MSLEAQTDGVPPLREAISTAERLSAVLKAAPFNASSAEMIFQRTLSTTVVGEALTPIIPDLAAAAALGHEFSIDLLDDGPITVVIAPNAEPYVLGSADFIADPILRLELQRCIELGNVQELIQKIDGRSWTLKAEFAARRQAAAWIPSTQILIRELRTAPWVSALIQLEKLAGAGCRTFVVSDLLGSVETAAVRFVGPDTDLGSLLELEEADPASRDFISARRDEGWPALPSPLTFHTDLNQSGSARELAEALNAAAAALVWLWLASEPPLVSPTGTTIGFQGIRNTQFELNPESGLPPVELQRTMRLWHWATALDDAIRRDAAHRAISIAVASSADTISAAGPALRTARTLYDLATSAAVAEALSTRRAGREAAAAAAVDAAKAARETTGSAIQRSLTLLGVGTALVLASIQKVVPWWSSTTALLLLAILLIGALTVARRIELSSASGLITSFRTDVEGYREALSEDDLAALRKLQVLTGAERDVGRAQVAVTSFYVASAGMALIFAAILAIAQPGG